jgi:hypothetical protein
LPRERWLRNKSNWRVLSIQIPGEENSPVPSDRSSSPSYRGYTLGNRDIALKLLNSIEQRAWCIVKKVQSEMLKDESFRL